MERLWIRLLPFLVLLGLCEAFLVADREREERSRSEVGRLEIHLGDALRAWRPELTQRASGKGKEALEALVTNLSRSLRAGLEVRDARGRILAAHGLDRDEPAASELPESGVSRTEKGRTLVVVRQPLLTSGPARIGEVRATAEVEEAGFPWETWSFVLLIQVFGIGIVLFAVTLALRPLSVLGAWFRRLGVEGAFRVGSPPPGIAEGGRLEADLRRGLEAMRGRELAVEESFVEVALCLAREHEFHTDGETGHAQRVRRYASWLAERLRFDPEKRDELEVAALCHDLGRIPPDSGSPWGRESIREERHPEEGARYFQALQGLQGAAEIIRHHHENFDGTGYPHRLSGEEIPVGARILRIADAFDRLRAEVAGAALEAGEALEAMEEDAGRIFDPELFALFKEEVLLRESDRKRVTLESAKSED